MTALTEETAKQDSKEDIRFSPKVSCFFLNLLSSLIILTLLHMQAAEIVSKAINP